MFNWEFHYPRLFCPRYLARSQHKLCHLPFVTLPIIQFNLLYLLPILVPWLGFWLIHNYSQRVNYAKLHHPSPAIEFPHWFFFRQKRVSLLGNPSVASNRASAGGLPPGQQDFSLHLPQRLPEDGGHVQSHQMQTGQFAVVQSHPQMQT